MKRIFICMAAVSMLAACSKDDGITDAIDRGETGGSAAIETPAESYTTYVSVATENGDTRATYDENLAPKWETDDVIYLHQMTAGNGGDNSLQELAIKDGVDTPTATFDGEVTLGEKGQRYFCFAYPSATVTTTDAIEAVSPIDYKFTSTSVDSWGYYEATGTYKHKYTTSVGIEIPKVQDGKWKPYMYAFSPSASTAGQLNSVHFETLNGAICLRVKDTDGESPKKLSSITISTKDGASIAGTYTITSTSEGSLNSLIGKSTTGTVYNESYDAERRGEALTDLENKARATSPATMSGNSKPEVSLSDGANKITVNNISNEIRAKGEYYINIAPVNATQGFTITLTDTHGLSLTFDTKAAEIGASQRKGYEITWEADAIGVEFDDSTGELMTSYSYYLNNDKDTANLKDAYTIYGATIKGKVNVSGNYKLLDITHYGLRIVKGETIVKELDSSYSDFPIDSATKTFEVNLNNLSGQSLGEYEYYLYIETIHGDRKSSTKPLYITGLPYTCNVGQNDGWTTSGNVSFGSYINLTTEGSIWDTKSTPASITRNFYVPANINVVAKSEFGSRQGRNRKTTFHLYVSGNEIAKQEDGFYGLDSDYSNTMHKFNNVSGNLTAGNPTVKMENTYENPNTYCYTQISSFSLKYGNKQ